MMKKVIFNTARSPWPWPFKTSYPWPYPWPFNIHGHLKLVHGFVEFFVGGIVVFSVACTS